MLISFGRRLSFTCSTLFPFILGCFVSGWLKLAPWGYFHVAIISPWERTWPIIRTDLNRFHQRIFCKVCLKLVMWFWRRRFLNVRSLRRWIRRQTTNISYFLKKYTPNALWIRLVSVLVGFLFDMQIYLFWISNH